ncbi:MAG TPA: nucleotidyl transferase AbiEii/AbiGii toxin family protein, partial [Clostridia bacterium]|nr:nucleotidyl transferase AbiEii/AbiGii toxin family protein [Clostridia bacterium]
MIPMESLLAQYPERLRGFKRLILSEYLQCLILSYIFPLKRGLNLRFIGGTAVRLGWESERFSEDLDFDGKGVTKESFGGLGMELERKLKLEGYDVKVDMSFKTAYRCFLRFPGVYYRYGLSQHPDERLIIQIDYEPQEYAYEPQEKILNRLGVFAPMLVPPLPTLLSMKI